MGEKLKSVRVVSLSALEGGEGPHLSPPPQAGEEREGAGGGEGRGEMGDTRGTAGTHLTLPRHWRGPLPLPLEGRRGEAFRRLEATQPG